MLAVYLAFYAATCVVPLVEAQDISQALWNVTWMTNNDKINDLVLAMTPEEKILIVHHTLYSGSQDFAGYIRSVPKRGIPTFSMTDGEAGVNGVLNTTAIPSQLNVAATFDKDMAYLHGKVAGKEARLLNASTILAPRVNILRDPVLGSFFQGYSEDPYLNGRLGAYAVNGIQDQGTLACSKQLGPTSTGASSGDANSKVDLQTLHEVYLPAHEELVKAGVATIMCSYAKVNGVYSCQNDELLNLTVRGDWNFTGAIMSDWPATHSTAASIIAGLNWEMGAETYFGTPLYDQIYVHKNLSETYLNRAVHQILSTYDRFGILDGHGAQGNATEMLLNSVALPNDVAAEHQRDAYSIAVRSGVLLKNNGVLPLKQKATLAVLGAAGMQLTNGGSGFNERAWGFEDRKIPLVDTLSKVTKSDISSAIGVDMHGKLIPGANLRTLDGQPGLARNSSSSDSGRKTVIDTTLNSEDSPLPGEASYEWTGQFLASSSGDYRISFQRYFPRPGAGVNATTWLSIFYTSTMLIDGKDAVDGYRAYLDGGIRPLSSPLPTFDFWDELGLDIYLTRGWHNITINVSPVFGDPIKARLHWVTPEDRVANIQAAVEVARNVDIPIVAAHADSPPSEGLQLIRGYNDLISNVSAANPNTVVVLYNAEPVVMPWLDSVAAVLWMGIPGQEGGWASADLLVGKHNPQGRLPVTYPTSLNTTMTRDPKYPNRVNVDDLEGTAVFSEGINTSYRWYIATNTSVLFPFGYGLSYSKFTYEDLTIVDTSDSSFDVSFTLSHAGSVPGAEAPQLYLGPPSGAHESYPGVQFAVSALAGFDSIYLTEGASRRVIFPISTRQLSFWNQSDRTWVLARGTRPVWIGKDAESPVLVGSVTV